MLNSGQHMFLVRPPVIVRHLSMPDSLRQCIPKCTLLTGSLQNGYDFTLQHKIGPIPVTLKGRIEIEEEAHNARYLINISGSSRFSGTIAAEVLLKLAAKPRGTLVSYDAETETTLLVRLLGKERAETYFAKAIDHVFDRLRLQVKDDAAGQTA